MSCKLNFKEALQTKIWSKKKEEGWAGGGGERRIIWKKSNSREEGGQNDIWFLTPIRYSLSCPNRANCPGGHGNDQMIMDNIAITREITLFGCCLFFLPVCCHFGLSVYNLIHYWVELRLNLILSCQLDGWMERHWTGRTSLSYVFKVKVKVIETGMSTYAISTAMCTLNAIP